MPVTGRGNLVRQAIGLLVHYPTAAASVGNVEKLADVERPGVALLLELLAQLREDPPANTAALLERWRERPEQVSLSKLAAGECLVPDAEAAAAEVRSAVERLVAEEAAHRLQALEDKSRTEPLTHEEKQELQTLISAKARSARPAAGG